MTVGPEVAAGPLLAGADLRKSFGGTEALRGAGLTVSAGEIMAVTGSSGSGKSTLLHCLAGIVRPDGGTVHYRGRDLLRLADAPATIDWAAPATLSAAALGTVAVATALTLPAVRAATRPSGLRAE